MFKISRLITNPNPGTNVFPAGTCGVVDVFVVVPAVGAGTAGAVGVREFSVFGADAGAGVLAAGGGGSAMPAGDSIFITGGGSGAGGVGGGAATGLDGFTGLDTLVGLVTDFVHVFVVSTQGPTAS